VRPLTQKIGMDKMLLDVEAACVVYPAGHAFNRDVSQNYEPASAKLARERTLALFRKHVG
jgi:carboxymethylenebutenolidase